MFIIIYNLNLNVFKLFIYSYMHLNKINNTLGTIYVFSIFLFSPFPETNMLMNLT